MSSDTSTAELEEFLDTCYEAVNMGRSKSKKYYKTVTPKKTLLMQDSQEEDEPANDVARDHNQQQISEFFTPEAALSKKRKTISPIDAEKQTPSASQDADMATILVEVKSIKSSLLKRMTTQSWCAHSILKYWS